MKREIKFRGSLLKASDSFKTYKKGTTIMGGYYKQGDKHFIVAHFNVFEVDEKSVGQFIGLKDKNGLDIYEGDVVKGVGVTSYDKPIIRTVAFDDKSARFGLTDLTGNITFEPLKWISFPLEILGNIFENPELLPQSKVATQA